MAQGVRVYIDPAGTVGQWAFTDEVGRDLRRNHMQHVEGLDVGFAAAIGQATHKGGTFVGAVHGDQPMAEIQVHGIFFDVLHQGRHVVGHTEQDCAGIEEAGFDRAQVTVA